MRLSEQWPYKTTWLLLYLLITIYGNKKSVLGLLFLQHTVYRERVPKKLFVIPCLRTSIWDKARLLDGGNSNLYRSKHPKAGGHTQTTRFLSRNTSETPPVPARPHLTPWGDFSFPPVPSFCHPRSAPSATSRCLPPPRWAGRGRHCVAFFYIILYLFF